jgi:hypothetical protein
LRGGSCAERAAAEAPLCSASMTKTLTACKKKQKLHTYLGGMLWRNGLYSS